MSKVVVYLLFGLLVFGVEACGRAKPCTKCPNVAGKYDENAPEASPGTSTCGQIGVSDSSGTVTIKQDGNRLSYISTLSNRYEGVLLEDDSVEFEPRKLDSIGGKPGHMYISMRFHEKESHWEFTSKTIATWDEGGCSVTGFSSGTQIE